jgi:hypothetical protein
MLDAEPSRLPIVPESVLRDYKVHEPTDSRFRAAARLRQALWREERGLPIGYYSPERGARRKLGNRLSTYAGLTGANFLDPEIARLVRRELAYREPGACVDENRVWSNLLSSMPLTFNLFGGLKLNPSCAESLFRRLYPELVKKVSHIQFEHSPGRGDPCFTADGTAFDAFVSCRGPDGSKTFLAFEVKYAETMTEPEARLRPRYDEWSKESGLFNEPDHPDLRRSPLQQCWREHMLAQALVANGLYDAGVYVLLAPEQNNQVARAGAAYARHLRNEPDKVRFEQMALEGLIAAIGKAGAKGLAAALNERYCDFSAVHALFQP